MRVLVACEFSGRVRDAFRAKGHDAWSCDLVPSETEGPHIVGDAIQAAYGARWDMLIAFPPCTYLCTSGLRWCSGDSPRAVERRAKQKEALAFVYELLHCPIDRIALENPMGIIGSRIRPYTQAIQPCWFGEPLMKTTCLWLKNLPPLVPTNKVEPEYVTSGTGRKWSKWFWDTSMIHPLSERSRVRSLTFQGIANAMADQWGSTGELMPRTVEEE